MIAHRSYSSRKNEVNPMKCPACGHSEMATKVQDETLSYGNQSLTLHAMHGEFCQACGEGVWDIESYRRYTEAQSALLGVAKADICADIRRIRKNLNLTQAELAEAFGVGKVAFSRYERGETRPPAPLVKLLKLLERHPELLTEVQGVNPEVEHSRDTNIRSTRTAKNQAAG